MRQLIGYIVLGGGVLAIVFWLLEQRDRGPAAPQDPASVSFRPSRTMLFVGLGLLVLGAAIALLRVGPGFEPAGQTPSTQAPAAPDTAALAAPSSPPAQAHDSPLPRGAADPATAAPATPGEFPTSDGSAIGRWIGRWVGPMGMVYVVAHDVRKKDPNAITVTGGNSYRKIVLNGSGRAEGERIEFEYELSSGGAGTLKGRMNKSGMSMRATRTERDGAVSSETLERTHK